MYPSTQSLAVGKPDTPIVVIDQALAASTGNEAPSSQEALPDGIEWAKPEGSSKKTVLPDPSKYLLVTYDEHLAELFSEAGLPCFAFTDAWPATPSAEPIYTDPLPQSLLQAAGDKDVLLLEAEADAQMVQRLKHLRDALLYQGARWVRRFATHSDKSAAANLGDILQTERGLEELANHMKTLRFQSSEEMTPIKLIVHDTSHTGKPLYYFIPNYPPSARHKVSEVMKQVVMNDENGNPQIIAKKVSSTCVWVERVIHCIEDGKTRYEMGYIPLSERLPCYLTGGDEMFILKGKESPYTSHNAQIQTRDQMGLEEFIHACQRPGQVRHAQGSKRRGWIKTGHEWAFLTAGGVITSAGHFDAHHPSAPLLPIPDGSADTATAVAISPKGNAQAWATIMIDQVLKNPLPALFCGAAVGGLLRNFSPDSENFLLHLYGQSSGGKTSVLKAAASILGDPATLIETWRATDNGLESRLRARNDTAMFLDECSQQADPKVLENAAYLIGNDSGKLRAARDGSPREAAKFRLVTLSTGEETLHKGQKKGGQEVRALEVSADLGGKLWGEATGVEMESLSRTLAANHGWGLEPLVKAILGRIEEKPDFFQQLMAAMTEGYRRTLPDQAPDIAKRRCKHYALATVGYWLLLDLVLKMTGETMTEAVRDQHLQRLRAFVAQHLLVLPTDQFTVSETDTLLAAVAEAVNVHRNKIQWKDEEPPKGEMWGFEYQDGVAIFNNRFADLVHPHDPSRVLEALEKTGTGERARKARLPKGESLRRKFINLQKLAQYLERQTINPASAKPGP